MGNSSEKILPIAGKSFESRVKLYILKNSFGLYVSEKENNDGTYITSNEVRTFVHKTDGIYADPQYLVIEINPGTIIKITKATTKIEKDGLYGFVILGDILDYHDLNVARLFKFDSYYPNIEVNDKLLFESQK